MLKFDLVTHHNTKRKERKDILAALDKTVELDASSPLNINF